MRSKERQLSKDADIWFHPNPSIFEAIFPNQEYTLPRKIFLQQFSEKVIGMINFTEKVRIYVKSILENLEVQKI